MAGRVTLIGLLIVCIVAGCGGGTSSPSTAPGGPAVLSPTGDTSPSFAELNAQLQAEFERLGIDPAKVSVAAPSGDKNAVFDLVAEVVDPDGDGPLNPTGIELVWTERLTGDYNQDGMVTGNDLTPIGQRWDHVINYDDPDLHDGLAYWPAGDPADSGAANWRLARVDGNDNGLIEIADITPIAQHWEEKLSGYRLYRKAPGSAEFERLYDPEDLYSNMTVVRPVDVNQTGPLRYSFVDPAPWQGEYDYYVIGWSELTGHSSSEAETESNHVTATMSVSTADVAPPTWDSTIGITSATDNGDGTVIIEWGTATDIAVPPAPASPPVSYSVYYSTVSPIDYAHAAKFEGLETTTWTSGKLVAGQEYFFAVRTQDSATPPNEDDNTTELGVTVTDPEPVEDYDPPVWTEVVSYQRPGYPEPRDYTVEGIKELRVGDGCLYITCADAMDVLNPPVHYDLYYISGREADSVFVEHGSKIINSEAEVIRDISKEYILPWDNRHYVHLCVRVRDSALLTNETDNHDGFSTAPSGMQQVPIDMNLPGIDQINLDQFHKVWSKSVYDRHSRTLYVCYYYTMDDHSAPEGTVWVLAVDMETGEWTKDFEVTFTDGFIHISEIAVTQSGEPWLQLYIAKGLGDGYSKYYHRTGSQSWEPWKPPNIQGGWEGCFDHNELPVFYVLDTSRVNPVSQWRLSYRWWDEEEETWQEEEVSDPAGQMTKSIVRPDGVTVLATTDELALGADPVDLYGHLFERSVAGEWVDIEKVLGAISVSTGQPYWESEWQMFVGLKYGVSPFYNGNDLWIYGDDGYWVFDKASLLEDERGFTRGPSWPAEGGGYHGGVFKVYNDGGLVTCFAGGHQFITCDPIQSTQSTLIPMQMESSTVVDYLTGWYASISSAVDVITQRVQLIHFSTSADVTWFDPEIGSAISEP